MRERKETANNSEEIGNGQMPRKWRVWSGLPPGYCSAVGEASWAATTALAAESGATGVMLNMVSDVLVLSLHSQKPVIPHSLLLPDIKPVLNIHSFL